MRKEYKEGEWQYTNMEYYCAHIRNVSGKEGIQSIFAKHRKHFNRTLLRNYSQFYIIDKNYT